MSDSSPSSAAGSAAGFAYQFERALYHLADGSSGTTVAIETTSDVVSEDEDGSTIQEEDKHRGSNTIPYGDTSRELWKTLKNWLDDIKEDRIDIEQSHFYLVTNKPIPEDYLVWDLSDEDNYGNTNTLDKLVSKSKDVPSSVEEYAGDVRNTDNQILKSLISRINVVDGTKDSNLEMYDSIISKLNIPEDVNNERVVNILLGWILRVSQENYRKGNNVKIEKSSFNTRLSRIIADEITDLVLRAASEIPEPSEYDLPDTNIFIKQIKKTKCTKF